jgi:hypothetical protein
MKLQFLPHDREPRGVAAPVVDAHDRWLIPPRFVPADDPQAAMVVTHGQYLDLHEIRDRHWLEWMRSHPDFMVVNRSRHPDQYR